MCAFVPSVSVNNEKRLMEDKGRKMCNSCCPPDFISIVERGSRPCGSFVFLLANKGKKGGDLLFNFCQICGISDGSQMV